MLARNRRAQTIVEFGTSFGISGLHLAAARATKAAGGW
jgi:predicted O-methyltransferase YrrM